MGTPVFSAGMESNKSRKLVFDRSVDNAPVCLPGSKSIAARAVVLSYVFGNRTRLTGLPDCDDTRELSAAMALLSQSRDGLTRYDLGTGGTSLRFFLALSASLSGKDMIIDCSDALRKRPLRPLIDALRQAGADIECLETEGCAPVRVRGRKLCGDGVAVNTEMSSQFASALLMVSSLWTSPFILPRTVNAVSRPYIDMTDRMVRTFCLFPQQYHVEADWSAASYFYEYALLNPGCEVVIRNMPPLTGSLQGDSACADIFSRTGVHTHVDDSGHGYICGDPEAISRVRQKREELIFDLGDQPDLVPALVVGLCFAGIYFRIVHISHLRHKESDRLEVLKTEMAKAGYEIEIGNDHLVWMGNKKPVVERPVFDSHSDHRIAMALSVATVAGGRIDLRDADAVTKSFPGFYNQIAKLGII